MAARDGGTPALQDVILVHVSVNRNMQRPRFEQGDYRHEIMETHAFGLPFLRVTATDVDTKVSSQLHYHPQDHSRDFGLNAAL